MISSRKIRVLIVDDSAIARDLLEKGLSRDSGIEVVGKACDVYAARDKLIYLKPDVMTLDVEMPKMDGIEFLKRLLPQYPIPTIIVSAVTIEGSRRALEAMDAGALDIVAKPSAASSSAFSEMIQELAEKIRTVATADLKKMRPMPTGRAVPTKKTPLPHDETASKLIAIGASTGGTTALHEIIEALPSEMPPIVIVQHIPPVFSRMFAESLDRGSRLTVREAEDGQALTHGLVLVAPGDRHLRVRRRREGGYMVSLGNGEKVSGHRPSVDELFGSVAEAAGEKAIGVLLTGMGRDGARGLGQMREAGAYCIAQDEESSVVWGMPREAWQEGAADALFSLDSIAAELASRVVRQEEKWRF